MSHVIAIFVVSKSLSEKKLEEEATCITWMGQYISQAVHTNFPDIGKKNCLKKVIKCAKSTNC